MIEPLSVSQLAKEMGQLLEGAVSGKAALIYDLADDLPSVEADIAQLSQVVMNLITNAAEAIREGAGVGGSDRRSFSHSSGWRAFGHADMARRPDGEGPMGPDRGWTGGERGK